MIKKIPYLVLIVSTALMLVFAIASNFVDSMFPYYACIASFIPIILLGLVLLFFAIKNGISDIIKKFKN